MVLLRSFPYPSIFFSLAFMTQFEMRQVFADKKDRYALDHQPEVVLSHIGNFLDEHTQVAFGQCSKNCRQVERFHPGWKTSALKLYLKSYENLSDEKKRKVIELLQITEEPVSKVLEAEFEMLPQKNQRRWGWKDLYGLMVELNMKIQSLDQIDAQYSSLKDHLIRAYARAKYQTKRAASISLGAASIISLLPAMSFSVVAGSMIQIGVICSLPIYSLASYTGMENYVAGAASLAFTPLALIGIPLFIPGLIMQGSSCWIFTAAEVGAQSDAQSYLLEFKKKRAEEFALKFGELPNLKLLRILADLPF